MENFDNADLIILCETVINDKYIRYRPIKMLRGTSFDAVLDRTGFLDIPPEIEEEDVNYPERYVICLRQRTNPDGELIEQYTDTLITAVIDEKINLSPYTPINWIEIENIN